VDIGPEILEVVVEAVLGKLRQKRKKKGMAEIEQHLQGNKRVIVYFLRYKVPNGDIGPAIELLSSTRFHGFPKAYKCKDILNDFGKFYSDVQKKMASGVEVEKSQKFSKGPNIFFLLKDGDIFFEINSKDELDVHLQGDVMPHDLTLYAMFSSEPAATRCRGGSVQEFEKMLEKLPELKVLVEENKIIASEREETGYLTCEYCNKEFILSSRVTSCDSKTHRNGISHHEQKQGCSWGSHQRPALQKAPSSLR